MKLFRRLLILLLAIGLILSVIFGEERSDGGMEPSVYIRSAKANRQEDGTYQVLVAFTTNTAGNPGEKLGVSVFCGEESQRISLTEETAEDVHSLEFVVSEQPEEVRAVLGSPGDVPLLVDAVAPVDGDRKLILKEASPGAMCELYFVAELWEVLSFPLELCPDPEGADVSSDNLVATLTADSEGAASLNLTQAGLPDGLYLLTGEEARYVCLPSMEASGELLSSTVTVILGQEQEE